MCSYDCSIFMFDKCISSRCVRHVLVSQSLELGPKSVNREQILAIEKKSRRRESSLFPETDQSPSRCFKLGSVPMLSPSLGRLRLSKKYSPTLWAGKWASSIKHLRQKRRTSNYFKPQRVKEQRSNLRSFFCRLCHTVDNLQSENQLKGKLREKLKNFAKSEA